MTSNLSQQTPPGQDVNFWLSISLLSKLAGVIIIFQVAITEGQNVNLFGGSKTAKPIIDKKRKSESKKPLEICIKFQSKKTLAISTIHAGVCILYSKLL